jgi:glutamate formiminotransferase/formiminotetrahydrofolate cyclodeaminase
MAASLLVMVCDLTAKSKKHAADRGRLRALSRKLSRNRDELIVLAREDARAYDLVLAAVRRSKKSTGGDPGGIRKALIHAARVPMKTASLCIDVLVSATEVAALGKMSASSDVGVAVLLAHAGYGGGAMNVRINIDGLEGLAFSAEAARKLRLLDERAEKLRDGALRTLGSRAK